MFENQRFVKDLGLFTVLLVLIGGSLFFSGEAMADNSSLVTQLQVG